MGSHLTKDPPADDSKEQWMEEDARLFIQIRNSIDSRYWASLITVNLLKS